MNLLGSTKKLKSFVKPGLIALIPVFLGCDSAEDTGTEFNLTTNIDVKFFELDFPATNLYIDSLRTDGENRVLVGSYTDALIGNVTAEGYFQYSYLRGTLPVGNQTAGIPNPVDTLKYDSVYLELEPLDLIPFQQSSTLSFYVVELTDTLTDGLIYLASKKEEISRTIATFEKNVNIATDTIYRVKLDDFWGRQLFSLASSITKDSTQLLIFYQFKDLGLAPTMNSNGLANIDIASANTQIKLYMSGDADSVYTAFFNIEGANYSHIERDRGASDFGAIVENDDFDLPDAKTILDPIAGLTTAFNIDGISSFFEDNPNIIINTAILDFDSEFISRDSLENFMFHFREADGGIFGPGFSVNPFSHIVMSDAGYLSALKDAAVAGFNADKEKYTLSPILFFQTIYNNYQESGEIIYIEPFEEDTIRISEIVLINQEEVTLQQAIFNNLGIKLRVYYTEVN